MRLALPFAQALIGGLNNTEINKYKVPFWPFSSLWFLALAGEELIGASLCFAYTQEGWVRQLGVTPKWQRKGIGSALLRHAFGEFKKRGFDKVGLAVEGDNLNAYTFYQKVGMKPVRQYDEYKKPIEIRGAQY